jgi:hypothetical protein
VLARRTGGEAGCDRTDDQHRVLAHVAPFGLPKA